MDSPSTRPIGPLDDDDLLSLVPSVGAFKLLGPCLLFQRVGEGGFGKVYRGRHLTFTYPFDCAVKCLFGERDVERFQQEATLGASLSHENLVRVFDAGSFAHLHYLVMEWVEGETVLDRARRRGGTLPFEEVLEIARQAALGLAHLHGKGLVHRDLKPANVMVGFDGIVKVADLGIAKAAAAGAPGPTLTGQVFGTPRYMPPEQFEDTSRVGPSGDIYSLGATLYRLLVGRDGLEGTSAREIERELERRGHPRIADAGLDLPGEFVALLDRCTLANAAKRPPDGAALAEALGRLGGARAKLGADEALVTLRAGGPPFGPTREDLAAARRTRPQTTRPIVEPATQPVDPPTATVANGTVAVRSDTWKPSAAATANPAPTTHTSHRGRNLALVGGGFVVVAAAVLFLLDPTPPAEPTASNGAAQSGAPPGAAATDPMTPAVAPLPAGDAPKPAPTEERVAASADAEPTAAPRQPEPAPPTLAGTELPGFRREPLPRLGASDRARDVVCYLPEWDADVPEALAQLRFVLPEPDGGYLIQLTEFSGAEFAALGLDANALPHRVPLARADLPQGDLSLEACERIVARLNELRPAAARWRFAVPTVDEWQRAARASAGREDATHPFAASDPEPRGVFQTTTLKAKETPKDGEAPGPGEVVTEDGVLAPAASHPQGELGLRNLVGNLGELCRNPSAADEAAVLGGSFQYSLDDSTLQRVRPRERRESFRDQGLRLCVQLDGR